MNRPREGDEVVEGSHSVIGAGGLGHILALSSAPDARSSSLGGKGRREGNVERVFPGDLCDIAIVSAHPGRVTRKMLTSLSTEAPIPTEEWQSLCVWESRAPDWDYIGTNSSSEGNSCWPSALVTSKPRGTLTFRDTAYVFLSSGRPQENKGNCSIPSTMASVTVCSESLIRGSTRKRGKINEPTRSRCSRDGLGLLVRIFSRVERRGT